MKLLHTAGYTPEELLGFKSVIYGNVIQAMKTLVENAKKFSLEVQDKVEPHVVIDGDTE
jgi:hypothetical protein